LRLKHLLRQPLRVLILGGIAASGLAVGPRLAVAAPIIGNAATVVRDVHSQLEAVNRVLVVDSELSQDEEVTTGPGSATRILLKDGTNIELGENSRLKLTKLVFDADPNQSKVAVKAIAGVFRWSSGNLPSHNYSITTPVATIGIRGTALEFIVGEGGLTTVALTRGEIIVANTHGESVILHPGEATTVLPPDPDGSQAPPSQAGGLPANLRDQIMKMTRTVRVNEVQGINPGSGGDNGDGGGAGIGGGAGGGANPTVTAGLPLPTSPTTGPGSTNRNSGGGTPPATDPNNNQPSDSPTQPAPPVVFQPPQGPTGNPLPTTPTVTPTTPTVTPPPVTGTTPPPVVTTPTTTTTTVQWGTVYDNTTKKTDLTIHLPTGGSVILTSITQNSATPSLFSLSQLAALNTPLSVDALGNALLGYLSFQPLPGDVGVFTDDVTFEDAEGDSWIWHFTATAVAAAEPATLLLFMGALGGLFFVRRRQQR
jgi:hypothetical protein